MKKLILLAFVSLITLGVSAQQARTASKGEQTVTIQTNGVCQKCADRFKENVPYFKGVKSYTYDMKTAKLTINYDAKKTNPDQLRQEVSKLGYNADNVKADAAARAKLPACCRAEKGSGCCSGGAGHGCGNKASAQGCGNHGNGQGCGNHGTAKACGNHGNAKACDKHQVPASKEASAKKDATVKTSDIRKK
ncbi:MAG: cation transporter [Bacteroidales bacterium]|nr:cation transporter [Bacteroidales bacterium]